MVPSWLRLLSLGASIGLAGCAHKGVVASATTTSGASVTRSAPSGARPAMLLAAIRAEEDDMDDDPRGTLAIGPDVIAACRGVQTAKAPRGEENLEWLYLLRSIASCAKEGTLGVRPIVLRGPARPQVIVKYIFTRLGVPDDHVVMTDSPNERVCADDDCDPSDLRVDIGLGAATEGATL